MARGYEDELGRSPKLTDGVPETFKVMVKIQSKERRFEVCALQRPRTSREGNLDDSPKVT